MTGRVKIKEQLTETKYLWGDSSEITGKWLTLVERNLQGDCMCFVDGRGLVDVRLADVEELSNASHG